MEKEEIAKECERMYEQIRIAEARLSEVRDICKHEKTYQGNYQWGGAGHTSLAEICEYCGKPVKFY